MTNIAAPVATNALVRSPAMPWRQWRSAPISDPDTKTAARLSANWALLIANSYSVNELDRISFVNQCRTSRVVPSLSVSSLHLAVTLGATGC
jgi:hypothetical protein